MTSRIRSNRKHLAPMILVLCLFVAGLAFFSVGCGNKRSSGGGGDGGGGPVTNAFHQASAQYGIPVKLLQAVAFYESDLSPEASAVPYLNTASTDDRRSLGFTVAETAFGVGREKLQIKGVENSDTLEVQILAYAKYIRENLENFEDLNANLGQPEDYYYWLRSMSKLHRGSANDGRNVQTVWANGVITTLNRGQTWQNEEGTETIELRPASPPISVDTFPIEAQGTFNLTLGRSEVYGARDFPLYRVPNNLPNAPDHIEIVHCPMTLSACLEIQNIQEKKDTARLRAHFVIPPFETDAMMQDGQEVALQVTPMDYAVEMTNSQGDLQEKTSAVVIMLTGKSGRYINGKRLNANPAWFTPRQLQALGSLVKNICQSLAQNYDDINITECRTPYHPRGVQFAAQAAFDPTYKWGDIPDFEETIFETYIKSNDSLPEGETRFEFSNRSKRYPAKSEFMINVRFPRSAGAIEIERAIRCPGGRIAWKVVHGSPIYGKTSTSIRTEIHDGGPNDNGQHFFRAKIYDETETLLAWSVDNIIVYNFDPEARPIAPNACRR